VQEARAIWRHVGRSDAGAAPLDARCNCSLRSRKAKRTWAWAPYCRLEVVTWQDVAQAWAGVLAEAAEAGAVWVVDPAASASARTVGIASRTSVACRAGR